MQLSFAPPLWLQRSHPIVRRYLRQPITRHFQALLLGLAISVFLLLGALSLPVLYCLFSLVALIYIAVSASDKVCRERRGATWDLVRLAPFTGRELLLSMWAASVWQLNRTWLMAAYRLLHGAIVIGLMVFSLLFGEIAAHDALPVLLSGTLLIVAQPFAEMYFSGMVGLAGANRLRDQGNAQGFAVSVVVIYWLTCMGSIALLLLTQQMRLSVHQLTAVFLVPVFLPVLLGYFALRVAESAFR